MKRLAVVDIEKVNNLIKNIDFESTKTLNKKATTTIQNISVKIESKRLSTFKRDKYTCIKCGKKASFFAIEKIKKDNPHLNLYSDDNKLFSAEHIIALSEGGKPCIDNMRCVCADCLAEFVHMRASKLSKSIKSPNNPKQFYDTLCAGLNLYKVTKNKKTRYLFEESLTAVQERYIGWEAQLVLNSNAIEKRKNIRHTMTMQEWSDFTGCYTVVTVNPWDDEQRLQFFINKPVIGKLDDSIVVGWCADKYCMIGTISQELFVPFEGDWKDSLCTPCWHTSQKRKLYTECKIEFIKKNVLVRKNIARPPVLEGEWLTDKEVSK